MNIPLHLIPDRIIKEYNPTKIAHNGNVFVEIRRVMYGLSQSGIMANKKLAKFLTKEVYFHTPHNPGFWTHAWRPITFVLVVDNFLVKYVIK